MSNTTNANYVHNQHYQRHQEDFKNELQQEDANIYKLSMYRQYVKMTLESGNKEASAWLMKFRKSTLAWRAAIETLKSGDSSSGEKLFAAQVLSYKSRRGPPAIDPNRQDLVLIGNEVRKSMTEIFVHYSSMPNFYPPILKQLAAAFTAQIARWPAVYDYVKTVDDMIVSFPPVGVAFLLSALPEISTNRGAAGLPPQRRIDYHRYLRLKIPSIHDFFIALAADSSNNNMSPIKQELAIRGFNAYIVTNCVPGKFLANCNLLKGVVEILITSNEENLLQACSEFVMNVAESIEEPVEEKKKRKESRDGSDYTVLNKEFFTPEHLENLIQAMFNIVKQSLSPAFVQLATKIHTVQTSSIETTNNNSSNENNNLIDQFKLKRYVEIFCFLCNILVPLALKKVDDKNVAIELLKPLLTVLMQATMNADWEIVRPTLFSWQTVGDFSYTSIGNFNPIEIVIEKLTEIIVYAAMYNKQYEDEYDEMEREEFHEYRNDVRDTLRYFCAPKRRPHTFSQTVNIAVRDAMTMLENIDNVTDNNWKKLEASLHAVGALNKFCDKNNGVLIPLYEAFYQLFPKLPHLHGAHCSAIVLVGQMSQWVAANPKYIEISLSIVMRSFSMKVNFNPSYPLKLKQNHVGAIAFEKIARDCSDVFFSKNPNYFLSLCKKLWAQQEIILEDRRDTMMVLNGLCYAASSIANSDIPQTVVEEMLLAPLLPIFNVAANQANSSAATISSNDLMFACKCLQIIFASYKPTTYTTLEGIQHGWHSLLFIEKYGQNLFSLLSYSNSNGVNTSTPEDESNVEEANESLCKAMKSVWDNMDDKVQVCNDPNKLILYVSSMVDGFGALLVKDLNAAGGRGGQNMAGYLHVFKSVLEFSVKNNIAENVITNAVIEIVRIVLKHQNVLHELPDACIIFSELLSIFVKSYPQFIIRSNVVAKNIIDVISTGLTIQYQKSGRKMIQVAEDCFLSVIKFVNDERCILEVIAPQLLYSILMAANGNMPSNVLEEIVKTFRNLWIGTSDELMQSVLRRIMTINTFPSTKTKDKTKQVFIAQIISDECRQSKARFKKLLKAFCGGKKKRDKMKALNLQKEQFKQQLQLQQQ
jgi:hypothetical protein